MVKEKSPANSLKGWNFQEWFVGNWKTLKELIKVGIPAIVGWVATQNPALTGVITVAGKLLLDTGEYYFKSIKG